MLLACCANTPIQQQRVTCFAQCLLRGSPHPSHVNDALWTCNVTLSRTRTLQAALSIIPQMLRFIWISTSDVSFHFFEKDRAAFRFLDRLFRVKGEFTGELGLSTTSWWMLFCMWWICCSLSCSCACRSVFSAIRHLACCCVSVVLRR